MYSEFDDIKIFNKIDIFEGFSTKIYSVLILTGTNSSTKSIFIKNHPALSSITSYQNLLSVFTPVLFYYYKRRNLWTNISRIRQNSKQ